MAILRYTEFESLSSGHGGCRRAAQIDDLFDRHRIDVQLIPPVVPAKPDVQSLLLHVAIAAFTRSPIELARIRSLRGLFYTGLYTASLRWELAKYKRESVLIWEPTSLGGSLLVGKIAKETGFRVIAIPHNLESLVPGQRSPESQLASPRWLQEELRYLGFADKVFCISREDQWLLRVHGVEAEYLPYFPNTETTDYLLKIRAEREKVQQNFLLILGTAYNPATRLGMRNLLTYLSQKPFPINRQLVVAGYGTELFKTKAICESVEYLGTVSNETLSELLLQAKAVLIHQAATSGALTRIVEMQIAGIPVIANVDAARSYFNAPGVFVYETLDELWELAAADLACTPAPNRVLKHEERFVSIIKNL